MRITGEGFMARGYREGYEQGYKEGYQEGYRQGILEGMANVLLRQLARRFGPLGAGVAERVRQADTAMLERWLDNILDARSLQEVFGDD